MQPGGVVGRVPAYVNTTERSIEPRPKINPLRAQTALDFGWSGSRPDSSLCSHHESMLGAKAMTPSLSTSSQAQRDFGPAQIPSLVSPTPSSESTTVSGHHPASFVGRPTGSTTLPSPLLLDNSVPSEATFASSNQSMMMNNGLIPKFPLVLDDLSPPSCLSPSLP